MTREEALQEIVARVRSTEYVDSAYVDCVDIEALRIAIEALKTKIVRCRDCKHNPTEAWFGCPMAGTKRRTEDTFCSFGERKEEE